MPCDECPLMAHERHSYVRFFPSDWVGGTARLPREHRSVYFDLCCYIWDTAQPVPPIEARLMLSDVPNSDQIVEDLVLMGKVERLEDGSLLVERAMDEAQRAYDQWQKRSFGGKGGRKTDSNTVGKTVPKSVPKSVEKSGPTENPRYNQNQNQSSSNEEQQGALGDRLTPEEVVEEWNDLAGSLGLSKVRKLTTSRRRRLEARLRQYPDLEDWQRAFKHIRETPFLRGDSNSGWRADFDFLLQDKSFTKLTEEAYGKD